MGNRYKGIYRINSNRMPKWNYSGNGTYFITVVTQGRVCNLGEIIDNKMILSDFGIIVYNQWYKSFEIRKELWSCEFQVMPNHFHALIELNKNGFKESTNNSNKDQKLDKAKTNNLSTINEKNTPISTYKNSVFKRRPKSISTFMAGYKQFTTTKINEFIDENNLQLEKYNVRNRFFQSNFHDHIVRDKEEFLRIKNYIINNPKNWIDDKFYV